MIKLIKYLKQYTLYVILGPLFKLIEAILELLLPIYMAKLIDHGFTSGDKSYIYHIGLQMLAICTIGVISALICQYLASIVSQGFGTNLRNDVFKKICSLSSSDIDKFGTSTLITRITNDINQVQLAVAMLIRLVIRAPFLCIGGLIMAIILDLKLSIIMAIVLPIFILILSIIIIKTMPMYKHLQQKLDNLTLIIRENLIGIRVVRAFNGYNNEKERFNNQNEDYSISSINIGKLSALLNPLTLFIMNISIILILWFGAIRIDTGNITTGTIVAYINYIMMILSALIVISQLIVLFTKSFVSSGRILEILNTEATITSTDNKLFNGNEAHCNHSDIHITNKAPILEFKNVSMNYDDSKSNSLENINFQVFKGETIGIIGGTGSGKSTLINLISRLYEVNSGEILINGINIKEYNVKTLRSIISLVPQKVSLFKGTIKDNILLGNADYDLSSNNTAFNSELNNVLDISNSSEFVHKLPDGYNTLLTVDGKNLSGGQRQRLTIARALIKNFEILILDDCFNALDAVTTKNIQTALQEQYKNATIFIISQRIHVIEYCDKILVLDNGKLIGNDNHKELLQTCNTYKQIYNSQQN